ncbi:hypothetical protein PCE1_003135 [Barthelona sp. PCE]
MSAASKSTRYATILRDNHTFIQIEELVRSGVAKADAKKLRDAGFSTVGMVLMTPRKELVNIKGLSEGKIENILNHCIEMGGGLLKTGNEIKLEQETNIQYIETGSKSVDQLLGGGVETGIITEVYGEFRTGKTQLCHSLVVSAAVAGKKVAYIDTEGTFRADRIEEIAIARGHDVEYIYDYIVYARAYTHEMQMQILIDIARKMSEGDFQLLIVDSITSLFRVDFQGRGELSERQQKLGAMLSRLMKTAAEFNVAVVMTNQVMADPSGGVMSFGDVKKPIGGHILAHASHCRLYARKGKGENRVIKLIDSPNRPEGEAAYVICEEGIKDGSL